MIVFQISVVVVELALLSAIVAVVLQALLQGIPQAPSAQRSNVGNTLIYLAVLVFLGSGISKLMHVSPAVTEMTLLQLTGWKYTFVASIEIVGGLLLLFPALRSLALIYTSAHCGGAICAHLIADQNFAMLPSAVVLSVCLLGVFLRHPESLWSLGKYSIVARPAALARMQEA